MAEVPRKLTDEAVVGKLAEGEDEDIRVLARGHAPAAVETLARLTKRRGGVPYGVMRQAAKDIIEIGHDRPATRDPGDRSSSLTVVLNLGVGGENPQTIEISSDQQKAELALAIEEIDNAEIVRTAEGVVVDVPDLVVANAGLPGGSGDDDGER